MELESYNVCATCKRRDAKLHRCTGCKFVQYCGRECQKKDWKEHKKLCESFATLPTPKKRDAGMKIVIGGNGLMDTLRRLVEADLRKHGTFTRGTPHRREYGVGNGVP